jgi:general secretion pathway protein F
MLIKKYKIVYQKNNKLKSIIIQAISLEKLKQDINYPKNIISINQKKEYKLVYIKSKLTTQKFLYLLQEINIMLEAKIQFPDAIDILLDQYNINTYEHSLLETISDALFNAISIHKALLKYKKDLPSIVIPIFQIAEDKGDIKVAVESLYIILSKKQYYKQLIISKLTYPLILLASLLIAVAIIFIYVIPKFEYMFHQLDAQLPLITIIMLNIKDFFNEYIYLIAIIILFFVFSIPIAINKFSKFKYNIDKMLVLKIPLVSKLLLTYEKYKLFLILKVLLLSKYKIPDALISAKLITSNSFILNKLNDIDIYIKQGKTIATSFKLVGIFNPLEIRLLLAGEKGNDMLNVIVNIQTIYEKKLEDNIGKFTIAIEPLLIGGIGLIILFVMLAIFMPIWQMGTVLG